MNPGAPDRGGSKIKMSSTGRHKVFNKVGLFKTNTVSLEMPVPSPGHYGFHSFPVVD
jgi:hypothetical protein